ncbi:acyl-CoA thioesterase [Fretibacter rubidus]|uniref:acyl-CoA thioesterase n=1 Tax=Fretibacter rubidus TaxID=570162 RepID=UPI00352AF5C5
MIFKKQPGFDAIVGSMTPDGDGFNVDILPAWKQGRTAYGGLTSGLALAACQKSVSDLPPLRSANINFIGPVDDRATFTATVLRKGRNVTTVKVVATTDKGTAADIVFTFGVTRKSDLTVDYPIIDAPKPQDCKRFTPKIAEPIVPKFFLRFETKLIDGARPMSGADRGYIRAWSRHSDVNSREGIASLMTLSDVLPPAALPMFKKMGPVSSVNFLLNFLVDAPKTTDGWWQVETSLSAAQNGYSSQVMRIYNYDGELVCEGMQMVAIFI